MMKEMLCQNLAKQLKELCFSPSIPRSSKAFTHEPTWLKKVLLQIPNGTKSRFPSLYLRTQSSLKFKSYFMKKYPFPSFVQD